MKITIQINQYSTLQSSVSTLQEAQLLFQQLDMQQLMSNPTNLITFLELHDPSFSSIALEYFKTDDEEKFRKQIASYQVSLETFKNYLAHCFNVSRNNVEIDLD